MPRKPSEAEVKGPGPGDTRAAVARWIDTGHLNPYPEAVRCAANQLARIAKWPHGLDLVDFQQAVIAYHQMLQRDSAWGRMPQRERDVWIKQFEATVANLLDLMQEAPRPPAQHGFPIRDNLLLHVLKYAMEVSIPAEESQARWRKMDDFERVFDRTGVNFEHALILYRQAQRADYGVRQPLAKPREETADRAFFAVCLWRYTYLAPPEIAEVASAMLDDDVSAGDVRRWIRTYSRQRVRDSEKREKP